jgi:hypothetical protein
MKGRGESRQAGESGQQPVVTWSTLEELFLPGYQWNIRNGESNTCAMVWINIPENPGVKGLVHSLWFCWEVVEPLSAGA